MRKIAALVFLIGNFFLIQAQEFPRGTISGRVTTVGGAALQGASVEIVNTQTSEKRVVAASEEGVFRISGLQFGRYRVVVRARGYLSNTAEDIELATDMGRELEVALKRQHSSESAHAVIPF